MTSAFTVRPAYRSLCFALSIMSLVAACNVDKASVGGLVVRIESDLSMPKDFDRVTLTITQAGAVLFNADNQVGEGQLLLPHEFPIGPTGGSSPVTVRGVAYLKGHAVIERTAITQVPASHVALLRLPLDYLCLGTTHEDGTSTCGMDQTCDQGLCASAVVADAELSDFDSPAAQAAERGAAVGGNAKCFDVLSCVNNASKATLDASCSFALPQGAQSGNVNVALKLPLGSAGICGAGACWVPLDSGSNGWSLNGTQVSLPASVCRDHPNQPAIEVQFSTGCISKTSTTPPCGTWSSITDPLGTSGVMMNPSMMSGNPPVFVGNACEGLPSEACGNCGMRTRTCQNGTWSAWSDCMDGGECSIGTTQPCGAGGTQLCESTCKWGECVGQTCYGPALQACGNCGTQKRTCDAKTASWSAWGPCTDGGVCTPGATESCGVNGTHGCGGNCQWGACGSQVCMGAPSTACGNCGSETRTCDASTAKWSAFSACSMEGACAPNATRACGSGGSQICGGNCQWDASCGGQMCTGAPTQACGNCGAQTRTCDSTTGKWSDWSTCAGTGACAPKQTRACGAGGTQTCGDSCMWNTECVGQTCTGGMTQTCGMCGTQSRTCDSTTGKWSAYGACSGEGACAPGAKQTCGAKGTQTCGADCAWGACTGQACTGDAMQACGKCGTQTRTCDGNSGKWSDWTACAGEKTCMPKATQGCQNGGKQMCNDSCQWETCMGQTCGAGALTQSCPQDAASGVAGCGTQSRTCDTNTGMFTNWTACTCPANSTQNCGSGGTQTCDATSCQWGICAGQGCGPGATTQACGNCGSQTRTCNSNTGKWSDWTTCAGEGACAPKATQDCGNSGKQTCTDTCQWSTCMGQKCDAGALTQACPQNAAGLPGCGTQTRTCDPNTGKLSDWTACTCSPNATQKCGSSGTQTCDPTSCQWNSTCIGQTCPAPMPTATCGTCGTRTVTCDGTMGTWTIGACSDDGVYDTQNDPSHCGTKCVACKPGEACAKGTCEAGVPVAGSGGNPDAGTGSGGIGGVIINARPSH